MNSHTTERFRRARDKLPAHVRQQARGAYKQFLRDPWHPSLQFKKVHSTLPIYSARISRDYRAVCTWVEDEVTWFWIGPHAEYDKLLAQL
ncbi:MAG: hypothetical protein HY741_04670 [Chloroflexi bacterium]|nr:hypothetical protein [Chloroflexota bacterium]